MVGEASIIFHHNLRYTNHSNPIVGNNSTQSLVNAKGLIYIKLFIFFHWVILIQLLSYRPNIEKWNLYGTTTYIRPAWHYDIFTGENRSILFFKVTSPRICDLRQAENEVLGLKSCQSTPLSMYLCICVSHDICIYTHVNHSFRFITYLNSLYFHRRKQMKMRSMASSISPMTPLPLVLTEQGTGLINFSSGLQVRENTSYSRSSRDWVPPRFMRPLNPEASAPHTLQLQL